MKELLSGLFGALIATLLTVFYNYITELVRRRSDILMDVVSYFDDIYSRVQNMHVHKIASYKGGKLLYTDEEYKVTSRELKAMLLSSMIRTRVALVYGEGDAKLQEYNKLQSMLLEGARILWAMKKENYQEGSGKIAVLFNNIDILRSDIEQKFLNSAKVNSITSELFERGTPTIYKFVSGLKKLKDKCILAFKGKMGN